MDAVGRYYYEGPGAPDYAEAYKWTRVAAAKGVAAAQTRLGLLLMTGLGVPDQDSKGAFSEFLKAAKQGNVEAMYLVGVAYVTGYGVEGSHDEALKWARLGAQKGHAGAQYLLGTMYLHGWGVTSDLPAATGWLLKAGAQGNAQAFELLAEMPDEVHADTIVPMLRQAAQAGSEKAPAALGLKLSELEDPKARAEGLAWLRQAARSNANARITLGKVLVGDCPHDAGFYHHEHGCVKWPAPDAAEGARILLAAAEAPGGAPAYLAVAHLYAEGQGVAKDMNEAYRWLKRAIASEAFKYPAMAELVWGLDDRYAGIPAEDKVYWARRAADDNHDASRLRLGRYYERGEGTPADPAEAAYWYTMAIATHEPALVPEAQAGLQRVMVTLTPAQREAVRRRVVAAFTPGF
jgi:hypothetical protein